MEYTEVMHVIRVSGAVSALVLFLVISAWAVKRLTAEKPSIAKELNNIAEGLRSESNKSLIIGDHHFARHETVSSRSGLPALLWVIRSSTISITNGESESAVASVDTQEQARELVQHFDLVFSLMKDSTDRYREKALDKLPTRFME